MVINQKYTLSNLEAAKLCEESYSFVNFKGFNENTSGFLRRYSHYDTLVFTGTDQIADWFAYNLNQYPERMPGYEDNYRVAGGFLAAFSSVYHILDEVLTNRYKPLYCVGHSLGGAVATIAADVFSAYGLVTFGSPRVVNRRYAKHIRECIPDIRRTAFVNDPVQYLGSPLYLGHVGDTNWLPPNKFFPPILHKIEHYVRHYDT